jgi:hypothetical protein
LGDEGSYRYRRDVLLHLWSHGVQPTERTRPELVRDFVRDLYKYEIRRLRERMLRREFPKETYAARVEELRRRYPVLSLRARDWVEPS